MRWVWGAVAAFAHLGVRLDLIPWQCVSGATRQIEALSFRLVACWLSLYLLLSGCATVGHRPSEVASSRIRLQVRQAAIGSAGIGSVAPLLGGAARTTLEAPPGVPLAGYGARHGRPSLGVHDPLLARACALSDGADTILIVSVDLVAVTEELYKAVYARVAAELPGIGPEDLLLCATHTHSGVGGLGRRWLERFATGHWDPRLFEQVTERIAEAAVRAARRLEPVTLTLGAVEAPELVRNRMTDGGAVASWLRAARVERVADGTALAIIVHWSAHATLLGSGNRWLSGDYPGAWARRLEARSPGATVPVLIGAVGDQTPVRAPDLDPSTVLRTRPSTLLGTGSPAALDDPFAQVERYADRLAAAYERLRWDAPPVAQADVRAVQVVATLPTPRVRIEGLRWLGPLARGLVRRSSRVSLLRIGPWTLIGVPGEPTAEAGALLEAAAPGASPWLVSLANGYIGYVVSEAQYATDAYEARMSSYGPRLAERLRQTVAALAEEVTPEADDPLPVVVLEGTPYEIGRQHGLRERAAVRACVAEVLGYFERLVPLPAGRRWAMQMVLDVLWRMMRPHVPERYHQELRGLADGSGVPLRQLERLHALAEISATCASFAAFGSATRQGRLIHGRSLDWNIRAGAQRYARLFLYRPDGRRPFVNIGFAGFIGVPAGINADGISVGEVGAYSTEQSFRGLPMALLLRRVLEESGSLEEAIGIIETAPRTRGFNYVIGASRQRRAVAVETTHRQCTVFADETRQIAGVPYAFVLPDTLFRADTALAPSIRERQWASRGDPRRPGLEPPDGAGAYERRYKVMAQLLEEHHGRVDVDAAIAIVRAVGQRSNVLSVVYADPELWVATARGTVPAARRTYHRYDLNALFGRPVEPVAEKAQRHAPDVREGEDRAVVTERQADPFGAAEGVPEAPAVGRAHRAIETGGDIENASGSHVGSQTDRVGLHHGG